MNIGTAQPTRESIAALLRRSDAAVEEALLRLHARQTQDEKHERDAKHRNSRGFSSAHAKRGSKYAEWIIGMRQGRRAQPGTCLQRQDHKDAAREIVLHYLDQLLDEANAKRAARNALCDDVEAAMNAAVREGDHAEAIAAAEQKVRRDAMHTARELVEGMLIKTRWTLQGYTSLVDLSQHHVGDATMQAPVVIPSGTSALVVQRGLLGTGAAAACVLVGNRRIWIATRTTDDL